MSSVATRAHPLGLLIGLAVLSSGCASIKDHKGYVPDSVLVATVSPGVDNKASVEGTLGRPSFVSQFDPNVWYYISRDTRQLAFSMPKAAEQMMLTVRFDAAGNVASVSKTGKETIERVRLAGDKTPTLGRNRGFFGELFGNIGRVGGSTPGATTADNPN